MKGELNMINRTKEIKVRFNDDELRQLNDAVKKSGLSREEYVRLLIKGYVPKDKPTPDLLELISQLRRIGNNLNQLVTIAHRTNSIDIKRYRKDTERLFNLIQEIYIIITQPIKIEDLD